MRPIALTIAGSDPSGGAGIQADLKTFHAFGVFGTAAITALTVQNTCGVAAVHDVPPAFVAAEVEAVLSDIQVGAAKTGMLSQPAVVEAVAAALRAHALERLVVDPVMVAKGGARLLSEAAVAALVRDLLPLALLVTPNAEEAAALAGMAVRDRADMYEAARRIAALGPRAVLVKGGHVEIEAGVAIDVLHDGRDFVEIAAPRADARFTHGTGCALSAAITALLARGRPLEDAVREAKSWITRAIANGFAPGRGHGVPGI
jgi:hydroxymethylpyrimidine/phosphomethylpyrimidine kinase